MIKTKLILTLLSVISLISSYAQESFNASGGNASGTNGSVSYSLGQVFGNTDAFISQGVQQPYEIFSVGIKEVALSKAISIFPNPVADKLTLQIEDYKPENLNYSLYDLHGKLIESKALTGANTQINANELPNATYFLNVMQDSKLIQSFKIIKNQ